MHVAAEGTRANSVLSHAAEKCPFANNIAVNITLQRWYTRTSACWTISGQAPSSQKQYRGASRENLENKDSILFGELTRILELVKRAAVSKISVKHIVENVMMDKEPET